MIEEQNSQYENSRRNNDSNDSQPERQRRPRIGENRMSSNNLPPTYEDMENQRNNRPKSEAYRRAEELFKK